MKNLKTFLFAICVALFASNAIAQKIDEDNGVITVDGKPYAKIVKTKAWLFNSNFSIQSLAGEELIFIKYHTRTKRGAWNEKTRKYDESEEIFYEVNFIGSGNMVTVNKSLAANGAMKLVVENKLIEGNAIDPEAEDRYVTVNHGRFAKPKVVTKSPVVINGDQITKDGKVLGKMLVRSTTATPELMSIAIYDASGEKIADVEALVADASEWNVKTMSDGKATSILYDTPEEREKLCAWLIDKGYLK